MQSATQPVNQYHSILPVLVSQGILNSAQLTAIPPMADNATIELYLRMNNLATEEQLLRAYALAYEIPFVHLRNKNIKSDIIKLIPETVARRYDIVAYDKKDDLLMVALSSPRRFRQASAAGPGGNIGLLRRLQDELHVKIAPALAPLEEIRAAYVGYEATAAAATAQEAAQAAAQPAAPDAVDQGGVPTPAPSPFSVVSLLNQTIDPATLHKFPEAVAKHYGFVAFAQPKPNEFFVAAIDPGGKATQQVIAYLREHNSVAITLYQTDQESLDYALGLYRPNQSSAPLINKETSLPGDRPAAPLPVPPPAVVPTVPNSAAAGSASPNPAWNPPPTAGKASQPKTPKKEADPLAATEVTADELIFGGNAEKAMAANLGGAKQSGPGGMKQSDDASMAAKVGTENLLDEYLGATMQSADDLAKLVRSGNVPKTVAGIVSLAAALRASDIHLEAEKDKIRLRYRIDGELQDMLLMPRVLLAPLVSRVKILSQMKIDENRVPQDGRFGVSTRGNEIDLRVSTLPTVFGEKVVIRLLDKTSGLMSLEAMGIDGDNLKRIIANVEKPYGIVLSTGPTGSGKSTTLYAILQRIARDNVNVVTLEDPVEYEIGGINQTQIKPKIGFTFAEGLRSILRQDPNIIMVGEIRDKETAEMATHAALTGHLVLSTLHTNDAAGALPRLINMGIEPFLITSSINAVIGQRLVRRICPKCKEEIKLPDAVVEDVRKLMENANVEARYKDPAQWHFFRGKGCPDCSSGYKGRIGIFEVLTMSEPIESLAVKKEPASVLQEQALKEGMITMKQDGIVKVLNGLTTLEEIMKATIE